MGLLGAGTNNARLAAMLRQLAQYHAKDSNNLFMVRIAQGLVHMGKGTLTVNPYHSDGQLMSPVAVAGLMGCLLRYGTSSFLVLTNNFHVFGLGSLLLHRLSYPITEGNCTSSNPVSV